MFRTRLHAFYAGKKVNGGQVVSWSNAADIFVTKKKSILAPFTTCKTLKILHMRMSGSHMVGPMAMRESMFEDGDADFDEDSMSDRQFEIDPMVANSDFTMSCDTTSGISSSREPQEHPPNEGSRKVQVNLGIILRALTRPRYSVYGETYYGLPIGLLDPRVFHHYKFWRLVTSLTADGSRPTITYSADTHGPSGIQTRTMKKSLSRFALLGRLIRKYGQLSTGIWIS